ncbi:hypothetical protein TrLO_g396 [Triparma laevis f. longispina]|uniref:alkylglycerone-phosphate synthase n=1 Tax=Triparma laevis f. longispina TaxID=1714387 RepID=A0A9W7FCS2_9STRA|nr:hypothetical protein TrLO_g396 [Triparma laevis f. longispina]
MVSASLPNINEANLDARWTWATSLTSTLPSSLSNDEKLDLYGAYKSATEGGPEGSRPGVWSVVARAKFDKWSEVWEEREESSTQPTSTQFKMRYIGLIEKLTGKQFIAETTTATTPPRTTTGSTNDNDTAVLMSAITIPQMPQIPRSLGIQVQAIDINPDTLDIVDLESIDWTGVKVFVFSHIFGSRLPLTKLSHLCKLNNVLLISDEAESFSPEQPILPNVDVTMRSYGLIKNCTTVSGATVHFKSERLMKIFKAKHDTYRISSVTSYRLKIVKSCLLVVLSNPIIYGIILNILKLINLNHDKIITSLLRGFSAGNWIEKIKQRPNKLIISNVGRLEKIYKRFKGVDRRKNNSEYLNTLLRRDKIVGKNVNTHNHWLHPIINSSSLPQISLEFKYDITSGATQLICIDPSCKMAYKLMNDIVYLPVRSTGFIGRVMLWTLLSNLDNLGISKIYLLLRSKKGKNVEERFDDLLSDSMYVDLDLGVCEFLEGDVNLGKLGIKYIPREINKIIHLAASVSFTQTLKDAYKSNCVSTINVCEFKEEIGAEMCHFSTAFIHNDKNIYKTDLGSDWNGEEVKKSIETDCYTASKVLQSYPNTYSFSKHLTEKLIKKYNTTIIRPSIVGPAVIYPKPEYAGEKGSTVTAGSAYYLSSLGKAVWELPRNRVGVVPVDLVCFYAVGKFWEGGGTWNACFGEGVEGFEWRGFLEVCSEIGRIGGNRTLTLISEEILCKPFSSPSPPDIEYYHQILPITLYNLRRTWLKLTGGKWEKFEKFRPFVDLPMLFRPFTKREFTFETDFPYSLNGEKYMVTCALAGSKFVDYPSTYTSTPLTLPRFSDLFWCLTMPIGNFWIRLVGFVLVKILRITSETLTVDLSSFSDYVQNGGGRKLVLCPTHRSLFDFMIVSFITFSIPELRIYNPFIIADAQFSKLPIVGTVCSGSGAIFIERGKGSKGVSKAIKKIKTSNRPVEIFVEGTRSRDRRFLKPKTGFLRAMIEEEEEEREYDMLPINISYERTPEQETMAGEMNVGQKKGLGIGGLISWGWNVLSGKVKLGRIHVTAGNVVNMSHKSNLNHVVKLIQQQQMKGVKVSGYHVKALTQSLGVESDIVRISLEELKVPFWEGDCALKPPKSEEERWTLSLAVAHVVAPHVKSQEWAEWLCSSRAPASNQISPTVNAFVQAWERVFELAENDAETAIQKLVKLGFEVNGLKVEHVLGYIFDGVGRPIEEEAVRIVLARKKRSGGSKREQQQEEEDKGGASIPTDQEEAFGAWGFADSKFVLDGKTVTLHSDRYSLGRRRLPKLVSFLEKELKTKIDLSRSIYPLPERVMVTPSRLPSNIKDDIVAIFGVDCVTMDDAERVRHGTGHCLSDVLKIRTNDVKRAPDAVVYVTCQEKVVELVKFAKEKKLCLIPFGGGTNVTEALQCPGYDVEGRCILSVDMRRMNKVLWVNAEDGIAKIEAGATGRVIQEELKKMGLTMGHQPDSYEFSTLGGWVATRASGMLKNKYGNIEDIVREVVVVGGDGGVMWQHHKEEEVGKSFGRGSFGMPELKDLVIGSEGNLCIVTSCVVKVTKLPEKTEFSSVVFNDFGAGLGFMRAVQSSGLKPASIRMMDHEQFKLGQVFKGSEGGGGLKKVVQGLALWWNGIETASMVAVTLKFEGGEIEVAAQQKAVSAATKDWGGVGGGGENGKAGYELTFAIAYLRDFALSFGLLAESFETFVNYSNLNVMVECVKQRVREAHAERGVCGEALISARVTQLYEDGACVYFYYIMDSSGLKDGNGVFGEIEQIARETILEYGGNVSHHHGVGKHRAKFVQGRVGGGVVDILRGVKREIDGENIFGVRNGVFE